MSYWEGTNWGEDMEKRQRETNSQKKPESPSPALPTMTPEQVKATYLRRCFDGLICRSDCRTDGECRRKPALPIKEEEKDELLKDWAQYKVPDWSGTAPEVMSEFVEGFVKVVAGEFLKIFVAFGFKDGITATIVNEPTAERFFLSFKKEGRPDPPAAPHPPALPIKEEEKKVPYGGPAEGGAMFYPEDRPSPSPIEQEKKDTGAIAFLEWVDYKRKEFGMLDYTAADLYKLFISATVSAPSKMWEHRAFEVSPSGFILSPWHPYFGVSIHIWWEERTASPAFPPSAPTSTAKPSIGESLEKVIAAQYTTGAHKEEDADPRMPLVDNARAIHSNIPVPTGPNIKPTPGEPAKDQGGELDKRIEALENDVRHVVFGPPPPDPEQDEKELKNFIESAKKMPTADFKPNKSPFAAHIENEKALSQPKDQEEVPEDELDADSLLEKLEGSKKYNAALMRDLSAARKRVEWLEKFSNYQSGVIDDRWKDIDLMTENEAALEKQIEAIQRERDELAAKKSPLTTITEERNAAKQALDRLYQELLAAKLLTPEIKVIYHKHVNSYR